jgi:dipeptidyl aminopeptidase/acylaminoacyl peptidase
MTSPRSSPPRQALTTSFPAVPVLTLIGLGAVLVLSLSLLTGSLPFAARSGGSASSAPGPVRTPTPSNVVVIPPDPRSTVPGTIAYVKSGSIWLQSGTQTRQLTNGPDDTMPAWSADGQWLYFIRTKEGPGRFPAEGQAVGYTLTYPELMRMAPDPAAEPERLASGRYKTGRYTWFYWLRQPAPAPDGKTVMLVSDAPDPTRSNVVLQSFSIRSGKLTRIGAAEQPPLGHQDPTWRPDGKLLLYVKNQRDGLRGTPRIMRLDPKTKKPAAFSGPGYTSPSYSPDGRYVAATKSSTLGTDIVILDGRNGAEIARVTDDGASFGPAWSPRGDALVFLRIDRGVTDLVMATISFESGLPQAVEEIPLTEAAGLDPASRPTWFIPPDELPPSPAPSATTSPSAAASVSP